MDGVAQAAFGSSQITIHCFALGNRNFIDIIKGELGMKAKRTKIFGTDDESSLREPLASYTMISRPIMAF
jgi:hypothetical protein